MPCWYLVSPALIGLTFYRKMTWLRMSSGCLRKMLNPCLSNTYGVFAGEAKNLLLWGELRGGLFSEGKNIPGDASKILMGDITELNSFYKLGKPL